MKWYFKIEKKCGRWKNYFISTYIIAWASYTKYKYWMMIAMHLVYILDGSKMNEHSHQRNTITKVRRREPDRRAGAIQVTDSTSLCQIWIDFEEGTRDLHTSFTILDLVKNASPKLDKLTVRRVRGVAHFFPGWTMRKIYPVIFLTFFSLFSLSLSIDRRYFSRTEPWEIEWATPR